MILLFPDLDTLRLALTTGTVPPAVSVEPVVAGFDDNGRPWIDTPAKLPRSTSNQLAKLGVATLKTYPGQGEDLSNWLQALPLQRQEQTPELGGNTPVLFELPEVGHLPEVVGEMLRLSVDRQSFRWLKDDDTGSGPVLLRVVGPPYYTLLRALDRERTGGAQVRAYVEQAPNVWVELGWSHPLVKTLTPKEGQSLLLRPPREWVYLADAPFRDIYEILDFRLPQARLDWQATDLKKRLIVPLRLIDGDRHDAELWVLRDDPVNQLDALVRDAKDSLLQRLLFAVGQRDGQLTIVVRVRPSKQPPPQLVLNAEPYSKYLKLDNLFVPRGTKIHPVLRRDAIRKLLADETAQINWLRPDPDKPGSFVPESMPDEAFRPLHEWVDYVLDHDRAALVSWIQQFKFDFEPFVCTEEASDPNPKPPERGRRKNTADDDVDETTTRLPRANPLPKKSRDAEYRVEKDDFAELEVLPPSQLQEELAALEKRFLEMPEALDDPARLPLWMEMASRNAALKNSADASICWMNLLWELLDVRAEADDVRRDTDSKRQAARRERLERLRELAARLGGEEELAWQWLRTESFLKENREKKFASLLGSRRLTSGHLDELLKVDSTAPHEVRALLACVVWGAHHETASKVLLGRLPAIQQFIEKNEKTVAIRAVWLAWNALTKLSGDALALARVRDRLLERLIVNGLSPEYNLPVFLRTAGHQNGENIQLIQSRLAPLHQAILEWCRQCNRVAETSEQYVELMFAFAAARLGQNEYCKQLSGHATALIDKRKKAGDDTFVVHDFLLKAFKYRIETALKGKPLKGPLPIAWRDDLDRVIPSKQPHMNTRYAVDRMLELSMILEPLEQIDPYQRYNRSPNQDELLSEIVKVTDINDAAELGVAVRNLIKPKSSKPRPPEDVAKILIQVLPLSARVGEALALELLAHVESLLQKLAGAADQSASMELQAQLLNRALAMAANYDKVDIVQRLLKYFTGLMRAAADARIYSRFMSQLFQQCMRILRKLGMRDEIGLVIDQAAKDLLRGKSIAAAREQMGDNWQFFVQLLLHLAEGWLILGNNDKADAVFNEARSILFARHETHSNLQVVPILNYCRLAATYAGALGYASAVHALPRFDELFRRMWHMPNARTTSAFYAELHLNVIEAVALSLVHDDFVMGPGARRWMDDDEFLVRRRIHRDHRFMLSKG